MQRCPTCLRDMPSARWQRRGGGKQSSISQRVSGPDVNLLTVLRLYYFLLMRASCRSLSGLPQRVGQAGRRAVPRPGLIAAGCEPARHIRLRYGRGPSRHAGRVRARAQRRRVVLQAVAARAAPVAPAEPRARHRSPPHGAHGQFRFDQSHDCDDAVGPASLGFSVGLIEHERQLGKPGVGSLAPRRRTDTRLVFRIAAAGEPGALARNRCARHPFRIPETLCLIHVVPHSLQHITSHISTRSPPSPR